MPKLVRRHVETKTRYGGLNRINEATGGATAQRMSTSGGAQVVVAEPGSATVCVMGPCARTYVCDQAGMNRILKGKQPERKARRASTAASETVWPPWVPTRRMP